ncbi:MAG TPA: prolipoprotein diacylglyceryl transferase [Janthinobacterium sp.]|nr:prolipoprotein diacylglyceryl transferase [Janthinobacterium sp.]
MLTHPMPDPIAFSIGPLHVHWYGLMYVLAFTMFILLGRVRIRQPHIAAQNWQKEDLDDMLFYGMLGVVLGGRLGEVLFYRPAFFLANPLEIFQVWHGGMSFHGGFLGVMLAMCLWSRKVGRNLFDVYDFVAPLVPLGYAAGRIGNFINAELPGRTAPPGLPWAMKWPGIALPVHPSPLYQALVDGLLVFVILWLYSRSARPRMAVGAMFTVLYGCARSFTEFFRVPDWVEIVGGVPITSGQALSIPMIVGGLIMLFWAYRRKESGSAPGRA